MHVDLLQLTRVHCCQCGQLAWCCAELSFGAWMVDYVEHMVLCVPCVSTACRDDENVGVVVHGCVCAGGDALFWLP